MSTTDAIPDAEVERYAEIAYNADPLGLNRPPSEVIPWREQAPEWQEAMRCYTRAILSALAADPVRRAEREVVEAAVDFFDAFYAIRTSNTHASAIAAVAPMIDKCSVLEDAAKALREARKGGG